METWQLFLVVSGAIFLLLILVLKLKLNAFIALLFISIATGLVSGLSGMQVIKSIQDGMGGILGYVAVIVGLGAIFGQILEASGGAQALATYLLSKFGKEKAPWALVIAGFIISIPVFLDVGFIILVPIIYALHKESKKSLLLYAIPLLAGMAVTHSFIPPTPGPVAVAEIIEADLGWVIMFGILIGVPTAIIAGPYFGKYIASKIQIDLPDFVQDQPEEAQHIVNPPFGLIVTLIGLPIFLIFLSTSTTVMANNGYPIDATLLDSLQFLGHPFVALLIATLLTIYLLGIKRGFTKSQLLDLSTKSLGPAGIIILITGAGGVFKQILIDSGIGEQLAAGLTSYNFSPVILAYIIAVLIRVTQGSATVAMITAAGIMSPIIEGLGYSEPYKAILVIAIAAGATILSHVNDSGFWLVGKYLGMNEKDTLRSWTVMETIISIVGFALALLLSQFV